MEFLSIEKYWDFNHYFYKISGGITFVAIRNHLEGNFTFVINGSFSSTLDEFISFCLFLKMGVIIISDVTS